MNCLQAEEYFSPHFEDTLDYQTLQDFEGHLAGCEACQQEYSRFQESVKATQQLPQIEPSPYFMPTLMQRLAEEQHSVDGVKGIGTGWKRLLDVFRRPIWAVSGIVALILTIGGTYLHQEGFLFDQDPVSTAETLEVTQDNRVTPTPRQPMQQHYVLKQVSYTNTSTRGGL